MTNSFSQAETPQVGAEAQLNEGMSVVPSNDSSMVHAEPIQGSPELQLPDDTSASDEETTTAANDEQIQASTEATDGDAEAPTAGVGKDATADTTESENADQGDENTSAEQDSQAQASTGVSPEEKKDVKKVTKKTKAASDYNLNYSDEQKKELERVTMVVGAEIERVRIDPRFHAIAFGDNALIDLKGAAMDGVGFKTPEVNRKHGKDEASTGESLMKYGPQHPLIVITGKMAEALGLKVIRFSNDDPTKPIFAGYTLIFLDGNGRMNHLLGLNPKDWPNNVYAIFPTKNSAGYYDILKSYEVINTQVTVWKPGDWVTKRILEEGVKAHKGWTSINQLRQKGYNYQAACEAITLGTDRIIKTDIISGDANRIFLHYDSAVKIHNALVKKFSEGDDNTLKTKAFPAKVSELWLPLSSKSGDEKATEYMIAFIDQFPQEQVKKIMEAKGSKKDGVRVTKDAIRIGILETEFNAYMEKHPFNTEK